MRRPGEAKDPWCCLSDKMQASLQGFDRGALTVYRSMHHVVARLTREEALEIIDDQLAKLEEKFETVYGEPQRRHGPRSAD